MKHLLNNISEEEKNSIREQHTGGMNLMIENFNKLISSKSGDVKPLVNEQHKEPVSYFDPEIGKQATSTSTDESITKWFGEISSKLKGLQIGAYKLDNNGKPTGDFKSYFIDGVSNPELGDIGAENVSSLYDIKYLTVVLNAHVLTKDYKGSTNLQLDVRFTMSKGFAVGVERVSIMDGKDYPELSTEDFNKKIIPKIGKIQLKNPCFEGYEYLGKNTGGNSNIKGLRATDEYFKKYDNNNNQIRLYKDKGNWNSGSGQIIPRNIESGGKLQEITWACSNGKLSVSKK